ncbi:OsmC-like protein [Hoeflea sp. IMCC20628]|uniref:OsmC family protein n=1 Tax=Hoeflea sp. IMCC20628 TaxID=1620421 RepID=UPI00063ADCC8|nr:OsmC family protein [Hoeflea sp. IMCC20628]AKH98913.1 OsmC-like protein [Hoeflea sp. IMCC20628]
MDNQIASCGHPLAFQAATGNRPSLLGMGRGKSTYKVETRMLSGHQKEAVVQEGADGQSWRMTSDEGQHLKGHDEAPFPLGFFNAGLLGDVMTRLSALAEAKGMSASDIAATLKNYYWFEGSFARGTGVGQADISELQFEGLNEQTRELVELALRASPAIDALKSVMPATFALYVNGQRKPITTLVASDAPDASDPYLVHAKPPEPLNTHRFDPIVKPGVVQEGERDPFPDTVEGRLLRRVSGRAAFTPEGAVCSDTWLDMPGMSHFHLISDDRAAGNVAPSSLGYFAAGVAFCFMTQLSRYMTAMKLKTGSLRLVQYWPFEIDDEGRGIAHPVDTHLFLNGTADAETHEMLVRVAANTCYLHAALRAELPPRVDTKLG